MRGIRLSIGKVLLAIAFVGIWFAALRSGSNDWYKLSYTSTVLILLFAAIAARYRGDFWYGFAVVGWGYFLLGYGPWFGDRPNGMAANRSLIPSGLISELPQSFVRPPPITPGSIVQPGLMTYDLRVANTVGVAHSMATMLFACIGGLVARSLAGRVVVKVPPSPETPTNSGARLHD